MHSRTKHGGEVPPHDAEIDRAGRYAVESKLSTNRIERYGGTKPNAILASVSETPMLMDQGMRPSKLPQPPQ